MPAALPSAVPGLKTGVFTPRGPLPLFCTLPYAWLAFFACDTAAAGSVACATAVATGFSAAATFGATFGATFVAAATVAFGKSFAAAWAPFATPPGPIHPNILEPP